MTVYILSLVYDYEGDELLNIYATPDAAKAFAEARTAEGWDGCIEWYVLGEDEDTGEKVWRGRSTAHGGQYAIAPWKVQP